MRNYNTLTLSIPFRRASTVTEKRKLGATKKLQHVWSMHRLPSTDELRRTTSRWSKRKEYYTLNLTATIVMCVCVSCHVCVTCVCVYIHVMLLTKLVSFKQCLFRGRTSVNGDKCW